MLVVVPAVPASAAPALAIHTRDNPANPQLLSSAFGRLTDVDVSSTGGTAANVTVTLSGTGLEIDTPVVDLDTVSTSERVNVEIRALTGGLHTLDIQVTSSNAPTVNASLPYMWAPGGAPLPATGDLTGRNYGNVDLYTFSGTSYEDRELLTFLDGDTAFIGLPPKGRPDCPSPSATKRAGCVSYRYDTSTGLVQVGGAIGRVLPKSIYTEGIGRGDDENGETFNKRVFTQRVGYPSPGKKYGATWQWTYDNYPDGLSFVKLTLRKNGTFYLKYTIDYKKSTVRVGTYSLTAPGLLKLKGKFGTELHTFAVRARSNGKADPSLGVWLMIGKGKHPDGALLKLKQ